MFKDPGSKSVFLFHLNLFVCPPETPAEKYKRSTQMFFLSHKTSPAFMLSSCHLSLQNSGCHGNSALSRMMMGLNSPGVRKPGGRGHLLVCLGAPRLMWERFCSQCWVCTGCYGIRFPDSGFFRIFYVYLTFMNLNFEFGESIRDDKPPVTKTNNVKQQ